jgi:uncharacterized membrane protein
VNPLGQMLEAWGEPAIRHAMIVHFPVVLSVIGLPLAVLAALVSRHRPPVLWTALGVYGLLVVTALMGRWSGEHAEDAISLGEEAHELLELHESLGDRVWIFAAAACALLAASLLEHRVVRLITAWLAVAAGLVVAGWIANTAHHGGRLVYEYGAGTKAPVIGLTEGDEAAGDPRLAFFRTSVRPILADHCLRCHNPRRAKRAGGLDLTSMASILKGGDTGGPAVVPGQPHESFLMTAVRHEEPDFEMPYEEDPLPPGQIAVLERWIAEGAVWESIAAPEPEEPGE